MLGVVVVVVVVMMVVGRGRSKSRCFPQPLVARTVSHARRLAEGGVTRSHTSRLTSGE